MLRPARLIALPRRSPCPVARRNEGLAFFGAGDGARHLTTCLFLRNGTALSGDVIWVDASTFTENGQFAAWKTDIALHHTIVAFNHAAIHCDEYAITASCCDIVGNEGGDWVDCLAGQEGVNGNFSSDPRFCNLATDDVTLGAASPCAPDHSPPGCGLIGALPVGCSTVAVEPQTWGG
jgi:hypothetical protein